MNPEFNALLSERVALAMGRMVLEDIAKSIRLEVLEFELRAAQAASTKSGE